MSVSFKQATSNTVVTASNAVLDPNTGKINTEYTIYNEGSARKYFTFSRDTSKRLIYINYPETIIPGKNCFANNTAGNKRLLKTTISANETVQLFFSHHNQCGSNINYAIMLWNPNSTTATVRATNFGYARGWGVAEFTPWVDFYSGNSLTKEVAPSSSTFLLDWRNISSTSDPFSGIMRITSDSTVSLLVYMWTGTDISAIDGGESQFDYNPSEAGNDYDKTPATKYTGIGEGYYLTASNTITTNDASGNGCYYWFASCDSNNTNEMIPIALSGLEGTTACKGAGYPIDNLGNWGAQYQFNTTLDNSNSSTAKTFRCYIGRNPAGGKFVIRYGANTYYTSMGNPTSLSGVAYKWNFMDVTVPAFQKETVTFQFSHATCGSSPIYMQWIIEE